MLYLNNGFLFSKYVKICINIKNIINTICLCKLPCFVSADAI